MQSQPYETDEIFIPIHGAAVLRIPDGGVLQQRRSFGAGIRRFHIHSRTRKPFHRNRLLRQISGKLSVANGLNLIHIKTGAWTSGGQTDEQTVEVYGSPKTYSFSFEVVVPYDAEQDNSVELTFEDYKGEKLSHTIPITVGKDLVPPVVTISKPTDDEKVFSPEEKVPFDIRITDEKRLGKAVLSCEKIGFSKNYTPVRPEDKFINIADELRIPELGTYIFLLEAYDAARQPYRPEYRGTD